MSRESDIKAILDADATLVAILTGGVYAAEDLGPNGIDRQDSRSDDAFDANGFLLPTALVKQRAEIPDGNVRDGMAQVLSTARVVEIWVYADEAAGYSAIDSALDRIFVLLEGEPLTGTFPLEVVNRIDRGRDEGALAGAAMGRIDFAIYSVIGD